LPSTDGRAAFRRTIASNVGMISTLGERFVHDRGLKLPGQLTDGRQPHAPS